MNITVLDGYTLNPGDLSWDRLNELGDVTIYDRTPEELILKRSEDAEILLTNKTPLTKDIINQLKNLKYIGVLATGYNIVDVKAAADNGVTVTNIPAYGTHSVAQMAIALLLELCHHVQEHSSAVRNGEWSKNPDFCFWKYPLIELAGKNMGIIGFGRIGRQVAAIAAAMGMNIIAADSNKENLPLLENFQWMDIPDLLEKSDVVSLHCPLTPQTEKLIDRKNLGLMKSSAFLINTSRGGLIMDDDLAEALNMGCIAGAGLDVLSIEPPDENNPLLKAKNCIITPHISWATKDARERLMEIVSDNVRAFVAGQPINRV